MRRKFLLASATSVLIGASAFAQHQQMSVDYMNDAFSSLPFNMHGTMTYSYIVDEYGNNIKDGALTINCKVNKTFEGWTDRWYEEVTVNGQSSVKATYKQGKLNGVINSNYKATLSDGIKNDNMTASMTGSFLNGVPNGSFIVKRNIPTKATLSANYKNGVLVGGFSCSLLDDDSHLAEYSGTLSQSGQLTGVWNLNGTKATFQNGVLISESTNEYSTRPAVVELAKQYATGAITKEQLEEKNIVVYENTIILGDYARIAIFRDSGINFEEIGGYDFTIPNHVKYEGFKELLSLTDAGAELLAQHVYKRLKDGYIDLDEAIFYEGYTDKYNSLCYEEEYNRYYIIMTKERQSQYLNSKYVIGGIQNNTERVYLSPKQMEKIDKVADGFYAERAGRLIDAIDDYMADAKCYESVEYLRGKRNVPLHILEKVQEEISAAYQKSLDELVPHETNENVVLWQWAEDKYYITKSSVEGFKPLLTGIEEKIAKIKAEEEARIAAEKAREEARIAAEKEAIKVELIKCLDFIVNEGKPSNISYDVYFDNHFTYNNKSEYWRLDASTLLKPFCPVISYEILDVTNTTIKCRLMKKGKKKSMIVYEIELEHGWGKLKLESFDINRAKLIEE